MRITVDYERSIRCRLGRHDQGDAEHGCQGAFRTILSGGIARFCLCPCHDASIPAPATFRMEQRTVQTRDGEMTVSVPVIDDSEGS